MVAEWDQADKACFVWPIGKHLWCGDGSRPATLTAEDLNWHCFSAGRLAGPDP